MTLIIRKASTFAAIEPPAILFDVDFVCHTYVDVM